MNIPVLSIVFNRSDTYQQTFNEIRKAKPKKYYIAADGPRKNVEGEAIRCQKTRDIIKQIDWDCEVHTLFREDNLGCKIAVSQAIKWFFENEEMGIILEDDCLPAQSFFNYCEKLLNHYKDDKRIGMISGHNYFGQTQEKSADYSIISTCGIWGWASWRRVLEGYNPDFSILANNDYKNINTICYNKKTEKKILSGSYDAATNKINTWDFQFAEYLIVNGFYTVMPSNNQIRNIGFIEDSTHTTDAPFWYLDSLYEFDKDIIVNEGLKPNKKLSKKIERFYLPQRKNISDSISIMVKACKRILRAIKKRVL